ncbi:hypothetical protein CXG81DRAFT_12601 [Caulochytrium protostelioides]|uniref:Choline/carnitine acyltransferase domain-containing protein n=1 Tax=Caulochytrium protostelioides TaxID=1555241 RepID=A0A4P9X6W8_9FUNG|nr:hypothetical protein CXG81DRAFT_12601 [Caulochytrium protostelioides]|eukprot:RKP00943.1 hypothetical protein CXG81DRAFT_12601 [Caulochytrium protostelioides]
MVRRLPTAAAAAAADGGFDSRPPSPLPPSTSRALAPPGTTFAHQMALPRLPVPALAHTCALLVINASALLPPKAFAALRSRIAPFLDDPATRARQRRLEARAARARQSSWLIDWWTHGAYLASRAPLPLGTSFFMAAPPRTSAPPAARRAAALVAAAMEFRAAILDGTLPPDRERGGAPLCMAQYRYLFHATRVPGRGDDDLRTADPLRHDHVVLIRHGQFFALPTTTPAATAAGGRRPLTVPELETAVAHVLATTAPRGSASASADGSAVAANDAGDADDDVPVGWLTAASRDAWFESRQALLAADAANAAALDAIETAAFCVALDDDAPATIEERSRACWHGRRRRPRTPPAAADAGPGESHGGNRFWDKSFHFIVFADGRAGFLGEHARIDATPTARLCAWVASAPASTMPAATSAPPAPAPPSPSTSPPSPSPAPPCALGVSAAWTARVAAHDLAVLVYTAYGTAAIKRWRCSPDAYTQLALQLASAGVHGAAPRPTYESVHTRRFAEGRTDVLRVVTPATVAWVTAMQDPRQSLAAQGRLGRKAAAQHTALMRNSQAAQGVDRHLLGLRQRGGGDDGDEGDDALPALLSDAALHATGHWALATSQVPATGLAGYGWGPSVPDGEGIAYLLRDDALQFTITSGFPRAHQRQWKARLRDALDRMQVVFAATAPDAA